MTQQRLNVGLIGCSELAEAAHVTALASLPELVGLTHCFDPDPVLACRVAARTGAAASTLGELLAGVDLAVVATGAYARSRYVVAACRAGLRAVVVDVPVGLTSAEVDWVQSEAATGATSVFVHAAGLSDPGWLRARAALGAADRPRLARFVRVVGDADLPRRAQTEPGAPGRLDADAIYTGLAARVLAAGATAPAQAASALTLLRDFALPDLASARRAVGGLSRLLDVTAFAGGVELVARSDDGVICHFTVREASGPSSATTEFVSADQHVTIEWPPPGLALAPSQISVANEAGEMRFDSLADGAHRAAWRDVCAAIHDGATAPYALADAAADQRFVEAAVRTLGGDTAPSGADSIAVFGAGVFASVHVAAAATRGRVVSVASRTPESAQARAALVGARAATFDDPEPLAGATAVVVAGVPSTHAAHALAALAAGLPVLVEKPMTATVGEARALAKDVAERGGRLVYGENWAFRPAIREAVAHARARRLREVRLEALWMAPPWGGYLDADYGGGVLFDSGAHAVELARLLLGRPVAQAVTATMVEGPTGVDVDADLVIDFAGGARAALHVAWGDGALRIRAEADGFALELAPAVSLRVDGMEIALPRASGVGAFLVDDGILAEHEALTSAEPVAADAADGLAVMEIASAAYYAAATGTTQQIPYQGDPDLAPIEIWRSYRRR